MKKVKIKEETRHRLLRAIYSSQELEAGNSAEIPEELEQRGDWFVGKINGKKLTQGDTNRVKSVLSSASKSHAFCRMDGTLGIKAN